MTRTTFDDHPSPVSSPEYDVLERQAIDHALRPFRCPSCQPEQKEPCANCGGTGRLWRGIGTGTLNDRGLRRLRQIAGRPSQEAGSALSTGSTVSMTSMLSRNVVTADSICLSWFGSNQP